MYLMIKLNNIYLPFLVIIFIVMCGITIKKFIVSDKNKYRALFAAIVLLINLIIDIL